MDSEFGAVRLRRSSCGTLRKTVASAAVVAVALASAVAASGCDSFDNSRLSEERAVYIFGTKGVPKEPSDGQYFPPADTDASNPSDITVDAPVPDIPGSDHYVCTDDICVCVPNCEARNCGTDGCDGTCGECTGCKSVCSQGVCIAELQADLECFENDIYWKDSCGSRGQKATDCGDAGCTPGSKACAKCEAMCEGRECGTQGGCNCGVCPSGESCAEGVCDVVCGDGKCASGVEHHCACPQDCAAPTCPGCCDGAVCKQGISDSECGKGGDACASCAGGKTCQNQACAFECGDGVCTVGFENCESCPADCGCTPTDVCWEQQCCSPQCQAKECGADACGGSCGTCPAPQFCATDEMCYGPLTELASVDYEGNGMPEVALDGGYVYWLNNYYNGQMYQSDIMRVPCSGGAAESIIAKVSGPFLVDGEYVYYPSGVSICKRQIGSNQCEVTIDAGGNVAMIIQDGLYIYWRSSSAIKKVSKEGGSALVVASIPNMYDMELDTASGYIYVSSGSDPFDSPGLLHRVNTLGGVPEELANADSTSNHAFLSLAVTSDSVYWFSGPNAVGKQAIWRVGKAGGVASKVADGETWNTNAGTTGAYIGGLSADDDGVCWVAQDTGVLKCLREADDQKHELTAGSAAPWGPFRLVVDDSGYYWATSKSVLRLSK